MPVPRQENGLRRLFNPPLPGRSSRPAEAPFRALRSQKRHARSMFVASATKSVLAYPEPMNPVIAIVLLAAPFAALAAAIAVIIVYLGKRTK
jgi:hypothetical protein